MSNINLLPWRAKRQAQQTRRFMAQLALVMALGISAIWGGLHYLQQQSQHQAWRNAKLRQASSELESALQQLELIRRQDQQWQARQALISQLQPRRRQTLRLLNLLPSWLPEGIRLDSVQFTAPILEIKGHASNYEQLANLMAYLEQTAWLSAPRLQAQALLEANLDVNQPAMQQFSLQLQTLEPNVEPPAMEPLIIKPPIIEPPNTEPNVESTIVSVPSAVFSAPPHSLAQEAL